MQYCITSACWRGFHGPALREWPLSRLLRASTCAVVLLLVALVTAGCDREDYATPIPAQQLQQMLNNSVSDASIPGALLAIQSPAGVWVGAAGKADLATGAPMTPDMQVRLASVTKSLTAILVMKLVEDQVLRLEDTVEQWLPGLIRRGSEITIERLLNHHAGIYSLTEIEAFWSALLANPAKDWTSGEVVAMIHDRTPSEYFNRFYYSNTGYYLLGMIVEAATGSTVADEITRRVLAPIGLTRTRLTRQGFLDDPRTRSYTMTPPDSGILTDNTDWNLSWDWTAGAGVSTGPDMLRLASALFGGRILSLATVARMTTPTEDGGGYGLGIGKLTDPTVFETTLIGHSGENPGAATMWYYFPEYDTTIFVAVNRSDGRTSPSQETVPVDGAAAVAEILQKAWKILRES